MPLGSPLDARIPVVIVELDLDTCSLSYGTAPCTASIPDGRNNYLRRSQEFDNVAVWLKSGNLTVTANAIAAPDGTVTADRYTVNASDPSGSSVAQVFAAPFTGGCRFFLWIKQGNRAVEYFQVDNDTTFNTLLADVTYTWATGVGVNCSVVDTAEGGWVRLQIRVNGGITAGDNLRFFPVFTFFVAPVTLGEFTYVWGGQVCFPAFTSDFRYIATTAATVPVNPSVAGTGISECFNTFPTCQDKANYTRTTKTYRFANQRLDGLQLAGEAPTFPVLLGVELAPTELTPRDGLGVRASCTVQLSDFVFNDEGVDPYIATRRTGSDWENKSTFARRFLARNANYENRVMRVISGFRDETGVLDLSTFTTRSYIIQMASWPNADGLWTLTGKDPLRLADSDRAVWPPRARIRVTEQVAIDGTQIFCDDADNRLATDFAAGQEYIRIGNEIIHMTAVSYLDGIAVVTAERATLPAFYPGPQFNIAAIINVDAGVTPCYLFEDVSLPEAVYTLLNEGAGIDGAYLPLTDWEDAMTAAGRSSLRLSTLLPEPVAVKDLISEITLLNVNVWWNDRASEVKLQAVLVNEPLAASWTDRANILDGSIEVAASSRTRVSQAWVYYAHQWPLAQMEKLESFYSIEAFADLEAEAVEFFGVEAAQETRTRWLPLTQGTDAVAMAVNVVLRYRYGKVGVSVMVDPKDNVPWSGDTVALVSYQVVDPLGSPTPVNMYILMAEEQWGEGGIMYRYSGEGQVTGILSPQVRQAGIASDSLPDYDSQTSIQKAANVSICADSGQFSDGTPAYTLAG